MAKLLCEHLDYQWRQALEWLVEQEDLGTPHQGAREIGPTISYYNIRGAPGLNDRNAGVLNGVSATIRSLLIGRGQSPFEVTLSVEPEWRNFDETSGENGLELRAGDEDRGRHRANQKPVILCLQYSL
jgi:hypothetical protein